MTKDFQNQLLKEVKPGVKPSDLKRLKRSKSADDLVNTPPTPLLQEQLKAKQQEIESLREKLEIKNEELNTLKAEKSNLLDDNLIARHQGLKDWFKQYQKTKQLEAELAEQIDYASEELIEQDQVITNLRTENRQLKQTNQSLQKDLDLTHRLIELRSNSLPDNSPNWDYLKPVLYALGTIVFTIWLLRTTN